MTIFLSQRPAKQSLFSLIQTDKSGMCKEITNIHKFFKRPQTAQQRSEIKKQVEPERAVQKVKAWIAKRKFLAEEVNDMARCQFLNHHR